MRLVMMQGQTRGEEFPLEEGSNLIGRWDPDGGAFPEIDLESYDDEAKVSRKHAVLTVTGDAVTVEDAGSTNGTFINRGTKLEAGLKYPLKEGDEIVVGKIVLRFELT